MTNLHANNNKYFDCTNQSLSLINNLNLILRFGKKFKRIILTIEYISFGSQPTLKDVRCEQYPKIKTRQR